MFDTGLSHHALLPKGGEGSSAAPLHLEPRTERPQLSCHAALIGRRMFSCVPLSDEVTWSYLYKKRNAGQVGRRVFRLKS